MDLPIVHKDVIVRPPGQEVVYTVTVKRHPLDNENDMYNVTDDPTERSNLYEAPAFAQR